MVAGRALSSPGKGGASFSAHAPHCCGSRTPRLSSIPRVQGSVVVAHQALVAPHLVGSSRTRDRTLVSCIGRPILNYWTARKVHLHHFYYSLSLETEHKECNVNLCLMAQANFKVNTSLSCDIVVSFGASAMEWSLQSLNEKA